MLSIGKLTDAGSAGYYEHAVASGREDYYSGRGEAAGEWVGDGTATLGLTGEVPAGALERLLAEGTHPLSGEQLRATAGSVVGFDLTFSAPKSVSVLYAAGIPTPGRRSWPVMRRRCVRRWGISSARRFRSGGAATGSSRSVPAG